MASSHPPPSPEPPGHDSSPFVPFVQETQKAHTSTGGFRIPPAFLGLLLALAVAVPTVVATLPQTGQAPAGDAAAPQGPADPAPPPPAGREPAHPARPPAPGVDPPDEAPAPPAEPPATPPGSQELQAVEDCAASLPGLRASCETVLGGDPGAAARYLDCREGAAAERCLSVLRDE